MYIGSFHFNNDEGEDAFSERLERELRRLGAEHVHVGSGVVKFKAHSFYDMGYFSKGSPLQAIGSGEIEIDSIQNRVRCWVQVRPAFFLTGCIILILIAVWHLLPLAFMWALLVLSSVFSFRHFLQRASLAA